MTLLRANPAKAGDAEPRGYSRSGHARRAASAADVIYVGCWRPFCRACESRAGGAALEAKGGPLPAAGVEWSVAG